MERLQDKRVWLGGGAVAALLIIAVGWFMFIGPELSSADGLRGQAAATRQQNSALQAKLDTLQRKSTQVSKYTAALQAALDALPYDSGLPAFTRQLTAQATTTRVGITGVVVGGITPLTSATATAAPAGSDAANATSEAPAATPATPTTAAGSLFSVQITITSAGPLANQIHFLNAIRTGGPRRALVNSVQLTPGAGSAATSIDRSSTLATQLTIFSAPQTAAQVAQLNKLLSGKIGN